MHPFGGRSWIPDTHRPIRTARTDKPAVTAERNAVDRSTVFHWRRQLLPAVSSPHLQHTVVSSGGNPVPSRTERHTPHRPLTAYVDGVQERSAVGVPDPNGVVVAP